MTDFIELPKKSADRVKGQLYINNKNEGIKWDGKQLRTMCRCGKSIPTYNNEGESTAVCCSSCKTPEMVNVVSKKCRCGKSQPTFNNEGESTAVCCSSCKTPEMVNVKHAKCRCGKSQPIYNNEGETRALCCSSCKTPEMVDVKNKKCRCGKSHPNYNNEGETRALCCSLCKTPEMVNVVSKRCTSEWCNTFCNNDKYDGYCLRCFMYLFPDKPVSRNYKTKEFAVVEYVTTEFPYVDWVADKMVNGGCSKRRPDLLLDLGYQVIIIEVDENQHTDYDCSCENKRIMELSQDEGHRPIVFIRFNPDNYVNTDGSKIISCWGTDGNGICVVKKSKKNEWVQRLNCLKESINYWINPENKTNKMVETVQLFYDDWN